MTMITEDESTLKLRLVSEFVNGEDVLLFRSVCVYPSSLSCQQSFSPVCEQLNLIRSIHSDK